MTSSLQRQLASLASPASSLLVPERRRSSIIFSPRDATKYDKDSFYQIGLDGLHELISKNSELFTPCLESILFAESSKKIERAVEDLEFNESLNLVVQEFLISLYPYMMVKGSLKCLEWLVYRFHIERFNVEAIIQCILPYYDTKTFVMVVQALEIERFQGNRPWEWLVPCIRSGAPLRKSVLFDNTNSRFVLCLFDALELVLKIHKKHPENLRIYLGFMSSTLIGILNKVKSDVSAKPLKVQNKKMISRTILNKISEMLRTIRENQEYHNLKNNDEIYSMAYVVMGMIAVLCREIPEMIDVTGSSIKQIFKIIIVNRGSSQLTETYLLLNLLIDYLKRGWIFKSPMTLHNTLADVSLVSQQWDLSVLAKSLILSNVAIENMLSPSKVLKIIENLQLSPEVKSDILRNSYLRYCDASPTKKAAKKFLTAFERQYPVEFEMACNQDSRFASDLTKHKSGKDIFVLSQHADAQIRADSVKRLIKRAVSKRTPPSGKKFYNQKNQKRKKFNVAKNAVVFKEKPIVPDKNPIAAILLPRFMDDSADVLSALVMRKVKILSKIFTNKTLTTGLLTIVKRNVAPKPTRLALKKICAIASTLTENESDLKKQIMAVIIPLLFPRKASQLKTAKTVLKTSFATDNEFLTKFQSVIQKEGLSPEELCKESYKVISLLDENAKPSLLSGLEPAVQATFACLLLSSTDVIRQILPTIKQAECVGGVAYPVDETNFVKCLIAAEKKEKLSLQLVFTTLSKTPTHDFDEIREVMKFVWKSAERVENRDTCMKFLGKFLKECFNSACDEFTFWRELLSHFCREKFLSKSCDYSKEIDFYLIRTIQFINSFILHQAIPVRTKKARTQITSTSNEQENGEGHKPLTRSQSKAVGDQNVLTLDTSQKKTRGKKKSTVDTIDVEPTSHSWILIKLLLSQCLTDDCLETRSCSLKCLKNLKEVEKGDKQFAYFINCVEQHAKEIRTDHEQVAVVVSRALEDKECISVKKLIVESLISGEDNEFEKIRLLKLCQHAGSQIFRQLQPTIRELMRTSPTSKLLYELLCLYDESVFDEELLDEALKYKELAKVVCKKISREAFDNYDLVSKRKLFAIFINRSMKCEVPEIKVAIQRCVRKWTFDSSIIGHELVICCGMERRNALALTNGKSTENPSSISKTKKEVGSSQSDENWPARAEVVLEFIQGKKRLSEKLKLIPSLFRILKTCIAMDEQSPLEYLKQLVLTALTMCCQEDEESEQVDQKEENKYSFNVDVIIECLRGSRNPQTHHHALILLNYAAKRFPEQVLHGVMSLFAFMGNSILRQDDAYSTQLIQQTVVTIIPTLATAGKGSSDQLSKMVVSAGIYRVFTSAVQDIPVHRRLPVFTSLVETLDPKNTMWQLCIILVDNALQRDRKRSNLNADLELAVDLVWSFEPSVVIHTVGMVYKFLASLPVYKKEISVEDFNGLKARQSAMERSTLDFGRKESPRDVLIVMHYVLELVSQICSKFASLENCKLEYDSFLEKCLTFSRLVSGLNEEKIFRLIAHKNFEVIDKINIALEPTDFIEVVGVILVRDDLTVKRKVMEMLNQRILQKVEWFGDLRKLLDLVPLLVEIAQNEPETDEMTTIVQTAFFSLKLIAKHLAMLHPDVFIPVFDLANKQTENKNKLLCASALLCMGELFCLKSLILPNLNIVTSAILKAFKASAKLQSLGADLMVYDAQDENQQEKTNGGSGDSDQSTMTAHLLCVSTITCLNKMIEHLGSFVGAKFLKKSLIAVLSISSQFGIGEKADHRKKVYEQKLRILLKSISTKIPLRNSLIPIQGAFTSLKTDSQAVCTLIRLLRDTLTSTTKPDFALIGHTITESFLEDFLSYRVKTTEIKLEQGEHTLKEDVDKVEDAVIDCLINGIIFKMSESHFRPFYHKIFDWAGDNVDKLITFYRFSAAAAERLKSLFVTFAGYVINQAVTVLDRDVRLTKAIVRFFYHIFLNDREGFVTTDRFNSLVKPLVDLIESEYVLGGEILIKDVNDTLIQLAVATNDLNRWQHLIELISFKANHSDKTVRLYVLSTLEAAANELSKDFLPLLPPAVPFLAELMNDDDPEVESETQKLLLKLEDIVGEPLQPYFTT